MNRKKAFTIILGVAAVALLSWGGIWIHQAVTAGKALSIQEAVGKGQIDVELYGTGRYSGEGVIDGTITNRTGRQLVIRIPAGTELVPKDRGKQKILVPLEERVELEPFEMKEVQLAGFCMDQGLGTPMDDTRFQVGRVVGGELGEYVKSMNPTQIRYAPGEVQHGVWEMTGGEGEGDASPVNPIQEDIPVYLPPQAQSESDEYMTFEWDEDEEP